MRTLYLIRGLPGSGKSTLARQLVSRVKDGITGRMFEGDDYFTNPYTGEYKYDGSQIDIAHAKCQQNANIAMMDGIEIIAISNTFSRRWEMQYYYDKAKQFGYTVIEITLTGQPFTSIHNVPQASIDKMRERWEK